MEYTPIGFAAKVAGAVVSRVGARVFGDWKEGCTPETTKDLKPGDLIEFARSATFLHIPTYEHWGMWIGKTHNGKVDECGFMIHRAGEAGKETSGKIKIHITEFKGVIGTSKWRVNNKPTPHANTSITGAQAVKRAMTKLNEEGYDLGYKNCEHFVKWARFDEAYSEQASSVGQGVSSLIGKAAS